MNRENQQFDHFMTAYYAHCAALGARLPSIPLVLLEEMQSDKWEWDNRVYLRGCWQGWKLHRESLSWSQEQPNSAGVYWYWNGDRRCAPLCVSVRIAGGQPVVSDVVGGREYAPMTGWWLSVEADPPATPEIH